MPKVIVEVLNGERQPRALGLIAPFAIDTDHQTFRGLDIGGDRGTETLPAENSPQEAVFVRAGEGAVRFTYHFDDGGPPTWPGELPPRIDNRFTTPSPELAREVATLTRKADCQREAVHRVVDYVAGQFHYGHGNGHIFDGEEAVPLLSCSIGGQRGTCVDINTYLVSSCNAVDIPVMYFAGYFFPEETGGAAEDMHCWVATWAEGQREEWDIAHHMKMGKAAIAPAYNPKPGRRYAMTWGHGLRFVVGGNDLEFSHFSEPEWVFPDGSRARPELSIRLEG